MGTARGGPKAGGDGGRTCGYVEGREEGGTGHPDWWNMLYSNGNGGGGCKLRTERLWARGGQQVAGNGQDCLSVSVLSTLIRKCDRVSNGRGHDRNVVAHGGAW